MASLRQLELGQTRIHDVGLENLKGLTNLKSLDLSNTQITDDGVKKLQQALPTCDIAPTAEQIRQRMAEIEQRQRAYTLQMNMAWQAWDTGRVARVLEHLDGLRPDSGQKDLRGFGWHYLWRLCHSVTLRGHIGTLWKVAFSPDGKTLATGSSDGTARLWDVAKRKERWRGTPLR